MATSVSSWRHLADKANQDLAKREDAQIDLIIDRADRRVHLCEMKFSVGPYELKDAYEKKLRQRMTILLPSHTLYLFQMFFVLLLSPCNGGFYCRSMR